MENLVSVIMPAYNAEKYIKEAIESVLNQTYPNFEFLIINDGSKDKTTEIVKSFKDKRIRFFDLPNNVGVSEARNIGLSYATGDWIAFIDSDDKWKPERLEALLSILKKYDYGKYFIADDSIICFDSSGVMKPYRSALQGGSPALYKKIVNNKGTLTLGLRELLFECNITFHPIVPSKPIKGNNLKFNRLLNWSEDAEFYIQHFRIGLRLILTNEAFYLYRLTPDSLTDLDPEDIYRKFGKFKNVIYEEVASDQETQKLFQEFFKHKENDFKYVEFTYALKKKHFLDAFILAFRNPVLPIKLLVRLPKSIKYRISALIREGAIK